jgi:penicillin-insensitive murein endopeptidase
MPFRFFSLLTTMMLTVFSADATASDWSQVEAPNDGPPRSIGQTNSGCISGAYTLPLEGDGYQVMHVERNRFYGHPTLIRAIERLGRKIEEQKLGVLLVGDLGQPRGGPMSFGHRSHQTGLDVDIWFSLDPKMLAVANPLRSNISAPSMLNAAKNGLNRSIWSNKQTEVLKLAANLLEVDRIFVNAYIKKELCEQVEGDRDWLRKIRPWYYHDDHFHMRLACPADSPACESQDPIPTGEGCDAGLDWWFQQHPATSTTTPPPPKPRLPEACQAVLLAP